MTTESTDAKLARMIEQHRANLALDLKIHTWAERHQEAWQDRLSLLLLVKTMGKALHQADRDPNCRIGTAQFVSAARLAGDETIKELR